MMPLRYFYLDEMGLASLYAQLHHREIVETTESNEGETSRNIGWSAALKNFFGIAIGTSGDSTEAAKEAITQRFRLRAENMLHEIQASLKARGDLHIDFNEAAELSRSAKEPCWVAGRHPFVAPQFTGGGGFDIVNRDKMVLFTSGIHEDSYSHSDDYFK